MRRLVTDVTGVSGTDLDVESGPCAPDRDDNLVESCEAHQAQMAGNTRCCDEASCPRADIVALTQQHQLTEEVRYVARAVAWTRERLYPEDLKQCFSRSFELPPECMLCNEFVRAYGEECEAISKRSSPPKYRVAGGTVDSSPASPDPGTSNQHIPWTPSVERIRAGDDAAAQKLYFRLETESRVCQLGCQTRGEAVRVRR